MVLWTVLITVMKLTVLTSVPLITSAVVVGTLHGVLYVCILHYAVMVTSIVTMEQMKTTVIFNVHNTCFHALILFVYISDVMELSNAWMILMNSTADLHIHYHQCTYQFLQEKICSIALFFLNVDMIVYKTVTLHTNMVSHYHMLESKSYGSSFFKLLSPKSVKYIAQKNT